MKQTTDVAETEGKAGYPSWVTLKRHAVDDDVTKKIESFKPLPHPAGKAAASFLQKDALVNTAMTRTHVLLTADRVEGFVSLCSGSVQLSERSIKSLGLRTEIKTMPAVVLTWIARHEDSATTGLELIETAFALARESAKNVGVAAFVLDPWDEKVADIWRNDPYPFRDSQQKRKGKPPRLWTPLEPT